MRLVMMGTGRFAVPTFHALLQSAHAIAALFTQPDRNARSSRAAAANPMRQVAEARGVPIHAPESVNSAESVALLRQLQPDVLVVCDYGQILRPAALAAAAHGGINLHGSLLPKYRGAAPVNWALLQGEQETGVTVIHMTPQLDAGPMVARRSTRILPDEDAEHLESRLAELGVEPVLEALGKLETWDGLSPLGEPQDLHLVSRAPRLTKEAGHLDWCLSAQAIRNRVRGLVPWPGTFTHWTNAKGERVRLIVRRVSTTDCLSATPGAPGEVVEASRERLVILAGDHCGVVIEQLQPAGKRLMSAAEFLRGHAVRPGDQLT